ncbi:hypothetical protein B0T13DRAFT_455968, partial [Neurospora crassa]
MRFLSSKQSGVGLKSQSQSHGTARQRRGDSVLRRSSFSSLHLLVLGTLFICSLSIRFLCDACWLRCLVVVFYVYVYAVHTCQKKKEKKKKKKKG